MADWLWLTVAVVLSWAGMGWFALAKPGHWQQVFAASAGSPPRWILRVLATAAVIGAGACCIRADHPSIAVLVWIMLASAAGVAVAMMLSRRPDLLRLLWPLAPRVHDR
ncbi:hypothetical protein T5B8_05616 [Salinisphaera sp. T5B8]|uniref:DUF3325 domain-containing protein n=1 Tax=Salinisphaera sp. T5B8 TaxID=1304154 RepID=UPI003340FD4E